MKITNPLNIPVDMITKQKIKYARNSCIVEVTENMPWVDIIDKEDTENSILLQNEEAEKFIARSEKLWNHYDITDEEAFLLAAYPYVDMLAE